MVKKSDKINKPKQKAMTKAELERVLLNNFVNLQKVLTNLSIKFDDLSNNLSKLLQLFEISAKSFAEKYSEEPEKNSSNKEFLKKLDSLLEQNKTIAKGIMLMEEKVRNKSPQQSQNQGIEGMARSRPLPKF